MKFNTFRENGALNSPRIFDAFEKGARYLGHEISKDADAIPVIWSVLWNGRMAPNRIIYEQARLNKKPVIIIEVGNFLRGQTWRISINHVNNLGIFGNDEDLDLDRNRKFKIRLHPYVPKRNPQILIACQHQKSLQWEGQPPMEHWITNMISKIRQFSSRKILVRPHPRSPISYHTNDAEILRPRLVPNTYDDFDIDYNYHCVINHNSGVPVQAALHGIPTICHESCLAFEVSSKWKDIENLEIPNREKWFIKLLHTEWFVEEIEKGIPLQRLEKYLI